MKPVIGITAVSEPDPAKERSGGDIKLNWNYAQAVADAGGVPILIPAQADPLEILPLLDGILIPGGADIDASNWGEENHPAVEPVAPARFNAERELLKLADRNMPVFGICYGCQFINVARGGSLIQHLPDKTTELVHTGGAVQDYEVEPGSQLEKVADALEIRGQSWHHQAIDSVGQGLKVVAHSADGTVEAIEASDRPWMIGVQWHPERSLNEAANRRLFDEFVSAAAEYRRTKSLTTTVK